MAETIQVYFIKFSILNNDNIDELIRPFDMGRFEVVIPRDLSKYSLVFGLIHDYSTIEYLQTQLQGRELVESNEQEFEIAKSLIGIDYWYIRG